LDSADPEHDAEVSGQDVRPVLYSGMVPRLKACSGVVLRASRMRPETKVLPITLGGCSHEPMGQFMDGLSRGQPA